MGTFFFTFETMQNNYWYKTRLVFSLIYDIKIIVFLSTSSPSLSSNPIPSFISLEKKTVLQWYQPNILYQVAIKPGTSPHIKAGRRQTSMKKGVSKVDISIRDSPHSHLYESHKNTKWHNRSMSAEGIGQLLRLLVVGSISLNSSEHWWVDSVVFIVLSLRE